MADAVHKAGEDHARRLLAASPGALFEVDLDGVIVFANPAAAALLKVPLDRIIGAAVDDAAFGPATLDGAPVPREQLPIFAAMRGESVRDAELAIRAPDGGLIYISGAADPLRDDDGKIIGAVMACTDLGAAKRVRDQLTQSREGMSYALAAAKMIAWDWDPASERVDHSGDVSASHADRVERRSEFQKLIHPDDRARVEDSFNRALETGDDYFCEYRLLLPGGVVRWIESRGRASKGPGGEPRMSGVLVDITARKASDAALADSEERVRIAIEGAGAGFYDLDLSTGEGVWAVAAFHMLGESPTPDGRAHFDMWLNRLHPEDSERVLAAHDAAEAGGGSLIIDYRIRRADTGEVRWLSTYGRILRRPDGTRRSIGIVFDVTDRRRAEEREKLLMREVDHRAKNVLAVVQSLLQLTPRRDVESFVHGVTGRIAAIARVHTLLAHSRWRAASVFQIVREELVAFRAGDQITLKGEDAAVEPEAAQAIGMIIHELATNAAKYGALSAKDGAVEVTLKPGDGALSLVWAERAEHIVGGPTRQGFGMRLIRQLAERQLDGATHFEWGDGFMRARLVFTTKIEAVEAAPERAAPLARAGGQALSGRRVMVLEDDGLISLALQEELERQGAHAAMCGSIDTALEYLRRDTPDVAVLDVNVHGRSAGPVAVALAERGAPFIYATGYSDELGELPRARIVRKPCTPEEVCAALSQLGAN